MVRLPQGLAALAVALAGAASDGCSAFDPVVVPRYELVGEGDNPELGITGAHWVAYDDQHSLTSACTNGAAGNHDPSQCSLLYDPPFDWDGPKCLDGTNDLNQGELEARGSTICIQGVLRPYERCTSPAAQCLETTNDNKPVDASNMWGAGVGLAFTANGEGWNADAHGVVGVAFDLSGIEDEKLGPKALNLRVEVPIELGPETQLSSQQPVMRDDGSVIGMDGMLYRYDCASSQVVASTLPEAQHTGTLQDVLSGSESRLLTSELHPLGSPFWQEKDESDWVPSPVHAGHNEFRWEKVLAPKESGYEFKGAPIVGIHFQVVHGTPSNARALPFAFCVSNLAFLMK